MHTCGQSCTQVIDHSEWSSRSVVLICGPPGSGKSTLAASLHTNVLELEQFDAEDYRLRLKLFGRKAWRIGRAPDPDWAVVRGAPSEAERRHHEELCRPARTIILLEPASVCHERVAARDRVTVGGEHESIDEWWRIWRSEHPVVPPEPQSRRWV